MSQIFSLVCFKKQTSMKVAPRRCVSLTEHWTNIRSSLMPDTREWDRGNGGEGSLCLLSGTKIGISKSDMHPDFRGFAHILLLAIIAWISKSHKGYLLQMGL